MAKEEEDQPNEEKAPAESGGGIKVWIPLIATLIVMPATAYLLSGIIAKDISKDIKKELGIKTTEKEDVDEENDEKAQKDDKKDGEKGDEKETTTDEVDLGKVLANIKGTSGSRYLMAQITLKGHKGKKIEKLAEKHKAQLLDKAKTILGSFTLREIDGGNAGVENQAKAMLMTTFGNVLGEDVIEAIYLTQFAIQ
tara:strand:- start:71 stop:658 length:588 start_codon:yes stop_codon:yes gene_type:complete